MTRIQIGAKRHTVASRKGQAGFSLTEAAVALSITGLMVGGVLKGVEVMEQGRILKSGTLLEQTATGHQLFIEKYGSMAGDLETASEYIAASAVDGDGNHVMTAASGAAALTTSEDGITDETYHYWSHLAAAGMGPGSLGYAVQDSTSAAKADARESLLDGSHFPTFPVGGFMQVVSGGTARATSTTATASTFPQIGLTDLYYRVGKGSSTALTSSGTVNTVPAISNVDLARMDVKFDDGRPSSGRMMTTTTSCINNAGASDLTTINYDYMGASASSCLLLYRAAAEGGNPATK